MINDDNDTKSWENIYYYGILPLGYITPMEAINYFCDLTREEELEK